MRCRFCVLLSLGCVFQQLVVHVLVKRRSLKSVPEDLWYLNLDGIEPMEMNHDRLEFPSPYQGDLLDRKLPLRPILRRLKLNLATNSDLRAVTFNV